MSISAEIVKPQPTPIVHRWTLYEDGSPVGVTRSATVVRAVRCHDEVVAALEEINALCGDFDDPLGIVRSVRIAALASLASARGEVAS